MSVETADKVEANGCFRIPHVPAMLLLELSDGSVTLDTIEAESCLSRFYEMAKKESPDDNAIGMFVLDKLIEWVGEKGAKIGHSDALRLEAGIRAAVEEWKKKLPDSLGSHIFTASTSLPLTG